MKEIGRKHSPKDTGYFPILNNEGEVVKKILIIGEELDQLPPLIQKHDARFMRTRQTLGDPVIRLERPRSVN